ncbi:MAG: helix-turn-helix domain-containing protein [Acidimicrobiia bacterium]|nr:helix-turn-helix domain-containing protein [Acidimicrobiia bacterium]
MARSRTLPDRAVRQARALLLAADGVSNQEIARRAEVTRGTVRRWRERFALEGTESVGQIRPGRGRPRKIAPEVAEAIVADTLHTVPDSGSSGWSTRTMGECHGVGKDTVCACIWGGGIPALETGDLCAGE